MWERQGFKLRCPTVLAPVCPWRVDRPESNPPQPPFIVLLLLQILIFTYNIHSKKLVDWLESNPCQPTPISFCLRYIVIFIYHLPKRIGGPRSRMHPSSANLILLLLLLLLLLYYYLYLKKLYIIYRKELVDQEAECIPHRPTSSSSLFLGLCFCLLPLPSLTLIMRLNHW